MLLVIIILKIVNESIPQVVVIHEKMELTTQTYGIDESRRHYSR